MNSTIGMRAKLTAACVAVVLFVGGTSMPDAFGEKAKQTMPVDWGKPILVDDFTRDRLGTDNWEVPIGSCEIRDGKLVVTSEGNFYLFYKQKLASNMAIEFDGMIPDTQKACDLAGILSANEFEPAIRHYQGAVGTSGNKYSAIHRGKVRTEGDEVVARSQLTLTAGKWYHIRAERQDEFVRLFVDGKKLLEYHDPLGFTHASHNRIGLYTYGTLTEFDNVKIYTCPISSQYRKDEMAKWDRVYEEFNQWCIDRLGAEKEPLIYQKFGKELKFIEDGSWRHISENAACIGWETNLPAKSYVEYGQTDTYGQRTPDQERHFYLHIHHLKGLEAGKTYHYRVVSVDERGNRIAGEDATFRTSKTPAAIYIPGDMAGPPYALDKAGATYVLTKDIVADSTALRITAKNITLDLNGHTITFNDKFGSAEAVDSAKNIRKGFHGSTGAPGIVGVRGGEGAKLFNGFVVQGKGGSGNVCDALLGVRATEIAGVALDFYGYQMNGFIWAGSADELHHNIVKDKGTELVDRHWAVRAISGCKRIHHNLIKRCRQRGISGGDEITHNEIYQDSYATNSLGISGKEVRGNRILGGGVHICAISWSPGMQVIGNLVHLQAEKTKTVRWTEYASGRAKGSSLNGIRLTQYGSGNTASSNPLYLNNLYSDNLVVVTSKDGCGGRGVQFSSHLQTKNLICKDSIIKVIGQDDRSGGTCVVTQGRTAANAQPLYYRNCTFIASRCNVRFGDGYSIGSNHRFQNCKFERVGTNPAFHTFALYRGWSDRHVFLDCEFGPGTKYNDVSWEGAQPQAYYSVAWTVTVKTAPGAKVRIRDRKGTEVFSGTADAEGKVSAPLTQCIIRPPAGKPDSASHIVKYDSHLEEVVTPHTVTVEKDGRKAEKQVTADKKQEIQIQP